MTRIKKPKNNSNLRTPYLSMNEKDNASKTVISTPTGSDILKCHQIDTRRTFRSEIRVNRPDETFWRLFLLTIPPRKRNLRKRFLHFVRQQIESNCCANNLLHIGANNGDLYHNPGENTWNWFVLTITPFGQMETGHCTQSSR